MLCSYPIFVVIIDKLYSYTAAFLGVLSEIGTTATGVGFTSSMTISFNKLAKLLSIWLLNS